MRERIGARLGLFLLAGVSLTALASCGQSSVAAHSAVTPSASAIAMPSEAPSPSATSNCSNGQQVSTSDQLTAALSGATAGASIVLAPGTYTGHFIAKAQGTSDSPIYLCGPREAVIDGGGIKSGYALYLNGAAWWNLVGFSVQDAQKGVVTDHASHVTISGLYVHDIGDEGIHLRSFSTDNIVDGNLVRRTGLHNHKFGEGIYVGSANSNWCKYTACKPDASDRNVIRGNDISDTTAENIDIKEGTTGGSLIDNHLSGVGMDPSSASAWVNVKGNDWTVDGNIGLISVKDGFQVHEVYAGWGMDNIFHLNQAAVDGPGYGYYVQHSSLDTQFGCDNTASGAARGLSNTKCSG